MFKIDFFSFVLKTPLLLSTFIFSCNYNYDKVSDNLGIENQTGLTNEKIGFDTIKSDILTPKCLACHSEAGAEKPTLETYDQVKNNLSGIEREVLINKTMPTSAPLASNLQTLLKKWISDGAPLVGSSVNETKPEEPVIDELIPRPVTFQYLKEKVLVGKCISCHFSGNPNKERTPMDNYVDVLSTEGLFEYSTIGIYIPDAEEPVVVPKEKQMPLAGSPQLTGQEKLIIALWVSDGKLNEAPVVNPEDPGSGGEPVPVEPEPQPEPTPAEPVPEPIPVEQSITFDEIKTKIIAPQCLKCHSVGKRFPELETYAQVIKNLESVKNRVFVVKNMPPRRMDLALEELLKKWIDSGTPEL